jgi:putative RNA 2'-phosphotransferase
MEDALVNGIGTKTLRPTGDVMSTLNYLELSKTVSHALRHEPWLYELEIDDEGWVSVDSVLDALRGEQLDWSNLLESDLVQMIANSDKRRHEIHEGKIRALYGHTIPGKLRKTPSTPPEFLYHGTSPKTIPSINTSGLLPMARQYIHLSVDTATATRVGKRKAKEPVVLQILAAKADSDGVRFYEGNEKIWLADHIPADYIIFGQCVSQSIDLI